MFRLFKDKQMDLGFRRHIRNQQYEQALALLENKDNFPKYENLEQPRSALHDAFNTLFKSLAEFDKSDKIKLVKFLKFAFKNTKSKNKIFDLIIDLLRQINEPAKKNSLINFLLEKGGKVYRDRLLNELMENSDIIGTEGFKRIIEKHSQQPEFLAKIRELGIKKFKFELLNYLNETFPNEMNFKELSKLSPEEREIVQYFFSLAKEQQVKLISRMDEFINGYRQVSYAGALLTCAQIRARKKDYQFNPTVLQNHEEFARYLKILKTSPKPLREKFIITGSHWISGDIKIDEKGKVSVLFIDSMGQEGYSMSVKEAAKNLADCFQNEKPDIYLSYEKRQFAWFACSIFALDDLRHLFTVERYLPEEYKTTGLFGYLEKQKAVMVKKQVQGLDATIVPIDLPLPLVRTMQSSKIEEVIKSRPLEEQSTLVKKIKLAGEKKTAEDSLKDHYVVIDDESKPPLKQNVRLDYVLDKMARENFKFLKANDENSLNKKMSEFTLASFEARMAPTPRVQDRKETTTGVFESLGSTLSSPDSSMEQQPNTVHLPVEVSNPKSTTQPEINQSIEEVKKITPAGS